MGSISTNANAHIIIAFDKLRSYRPLDNGYRFFPGPNVSLAEARNAMWFHY